MAELFKAGVQYDDWKGSFAADELDAGGLRALFAPQLLSGEFLVGFRLRVGENHAGRPSTPRLIGFAVNGTEFQSAKDYLEKAVPIELRRLEVDITPADFLMLFKRLEIMAEWKGMPLHGNEFRVI
jgi:hypothetical protein